MKPCVVVLLVCFLAFTFASEVVELEFLKDSYLDLVRSSDRIKASEHEKIVAEILSQMKSEEAVPTKALEWFSGSPSPLKPLEVCIVTSSLEGFTLNSGIGTFYSALAELLAKNGHKVTIIYTNEMGSQDMVSFPVGIEVKPLETSTEIDAPSAAKKSYQLYTQLKQENFQVIYFPEWEGLAYYTLIAKRDGLAFTNTQVVVGLHGPTHWVASSNRESPILTAQDELEVDFMERKSVEYADFLWTPSSSMVNWVAAKGWKIPQSTFKLPLLPGYDFSAVPVEQSDSVRELVFFGRLETRKGLVLFCDAIDELSQKYPDEAITITFLGTPSVEHINGLEAVEYITERANNWNFFWKVIADSNRKDALEYLSQTNDRAVVIPSLTDNAPYTVYECLLSGIPFVASNLESISSLIVESDRKNLFEPTVAALSAKLEAVITQGVHASKSVWTASSIESAWMGFISYIASEQSAAAPSDSSPLVSIILTHYNRPSLLLQAIESIEQQEYPTIEVVLVDDGSNLPEASSLLEHLETPFNARGWKIVRTANKYLGAARNTGANLATGKYLFFLDDDNYLKSNAISTYVSVAEKLNVQIVTAAHSVFQSLEPPSPSTTVERVWVPLGNSIAVGLFRNCFGDANFLVKRDSFAQQPFTEEQSVGFEDYEFHVNAALKGWKSAVIPESLMWYRMHDDGQMIHSTNSLLNRLRSLRPYASKMNTLAPVMRFLASVEQLGSSASSCGDGVCNITGGENCVNCYEDCNSICKCPGDPVSRCSNQGACRITVDNGRTKAYCDCRSSYACCDCRMNMNNPGGIQFATLSDTTSSSLAFDLLAANNGLRVQFESKTFRGPVNVCFQEYTGLNVLSYPQPFVDPAKVKPKFSAAPLNPSGGWFIEFVDADTNVPQGEFDKPVVFVWKQTQATSRKAMPYYFDEFTEDWESTAFTFDNDNTMMVHKSNRDHTVSFNVGSLPGCGAQFQMYDTEGPSSTGTRTSGSRTSGSQPPRPVSRTSGSSHGSRGTSSGSRTSGGHQTSGSRISRGTSGGSRTSGSRTSGSSRPTSVVTTMVTNDTMTAPPVTSVPVTSQPSSRRVPSRQSRPSARSSRPTSTDGSLSGSSHLLASMATIAFALLSTFLF